MIYIITFSLWKHLLCILDWCIARWGSKNKHQVYTSLKESGCGPRRPQTTTGYPTMQEEVGGSILGCEISSLLDGKLVGWSTASCALVLACQPSVSKKKKKEKEKEIGLSLHNSLTNLHSIVKHCQRAFVFQTMQVHFSMYQVCGCVSLRYISVARI